MEDQRSILKKVFGYDSFRPGQEEIVKRLLGGQDVLAVMPTGAGKSICYQVPALLLPGITLVVSPLVSLMKDQVGALVQAGVAAAFLNNSLTDNQKALMLHRAREGWYKIIYVAPERLEMPGFQRLVQEREISMVTVDEAHCISQWGQDFRPSYLRIRDFVASLPQRPVVGAFTATATAHVRDDIREHLALQKPYEVTTSFDRPNLYFETRRALPSQKPKELLDLVLKEGDNAGIVYCSTTKQVDETARLLQSRGIRAAAYHAKLDADTRRKNQDDFLYDRAQIMVATNAFGMGIDKPDVRTVIHTDCPDSLEAYFQEAGRAGRDGAKAYAVLLYNGADSRKLAKRIDDNFPEKEYIRKVYEHLAYFFQVAEGYGENITFEFNIEKFCHTFKHFPLRVNSALKILDRAGYIDYAEEQDNAARVMMTVTRDELYRLTNNTPNEDKVIITLLRSYGGLFSDFRFIDEGIVAQRAGLMQPQVHEALKALGRKRVLKFIPRRATPVVRYRRRREDPARLVFPKDAYEERRRQFAERIGAMMRYATNDDKCRSQQLLGYFGEDTAQPCGHCDVCLDSKGNPADTAGAEEVRAAIERLLGDGMRHHITELLGIKQPPETVDATLRRLIEEEHIYQEDGFIYKGH